MRGARAWLGFLALGGAGCLSTPPPAGDGGGIDAQPPDPCDRDVRPTQACGQRDAFTAMAFPGRPFELRQAMIDDLNADGDQDLILVSNAAPPDAGIYVLLGPVSHSAPQYHAFVQTDLEVGDVQIRQVVGDTGAERCADLTVFGRTFDALGGVVQVWPYATAGGDMFAAAPITADPGFVPDVPNVPVHATWARLRTVGDDLVVGDLATLRVLRTGGEVAALDTAQVDRALHIAVPKTSGWDSINGVDAFAVGDCTQDQVLVAEGFHGHVLDDSGAEPAGGPQLDMPALTLNTKFADLDGEPPLDVVVSGTNTFGAYLQDDDGGAAGISIASGPSGYEPQGMSFRIDGFAVGDLGGSGAPEYVAIDSPDQGAAGEDRVILIGGLSISGQPPGQILSGDTPRVYASLPGGFVPRDVVIGDLDDDDVPEAWVISTDGQLACFHRGTTIPQLEACP